MAGVPSSAAAIVSWKLSPTKASPFIISVVTWPVRSKIASPSLSGSPSFAIVSHSSTGAMVVGDGNGFTTKVKVMVS